MTVSVQRIYATPPIQYEAAPADVFSEARALQTVSHLAETVGLRLVSYSFSKPAVSIGHSSHKRLLQRKNKT